MLDVWPANCKGSVHKEGKQIVSTIPLNYVWKQQFLILKAELSAGEMFWPKREEHISAGYASDQLLPSGPTNTLAFVSWVKPFFSTTVEIQTVNTQTCSELLHLKTCFAEFEHKRWSGSFSHLTEAT